MTTTRTTIKPLHPMAASVRFDVSNEDRFRRNLEQWAAEITNAIAVDPLGASGAGELPVGAAVGDLLYSASVDHWDRLAIGTAGKWLRTNGTVPSWSTPTLANSYVRGDVVVATAANILAGKAIGANGRWFGSDGTDPQWNAPAALTRVDDTNVTLVLGGSPSTALLNAASLTLGWTGQLAVARGGTGAATLTSGSLIVGQGTSAVAFLTAAQGDLIYGSGAGTWSKRSLGTTGYYLAAGATTPDWTAPAALTRVDDTNVTLTLGGSASTALLNAASLTLGWTGTLGPTRGGTGTGTVAVGDLLYGSGVNTWSKLAANATATNKFLRDVSSGAPSWEQVAFADLSGTLTYAQLPSAATRTWALGGDATFSGGNVFLDANKALKWVTDNTVGGTIGASAANRPYGVYVGTEVIVGTMTTLPAFLGSHPLQVYGSIDTTSPINIVRSGGTGCLTGYVYANSGLMSLFRFNGSIGSESAVLLDQEMGRWQFGGYDGNTAAGSSGASIAANAGANWSNTDHSSRLIFYTVPVGSTTVTARWIMFESGTWRPSADNTVNIGSASFRPTSIFGYTLDASTRVTAPLLGTTTATNVVFDRNSVTQLTLGSLAATFAGTCAATQFLGPILDSNAASDLLLKRNAVTQLTLASLVATFAGTAAATEFLAPSFDTGSAVDMVLQRNNVTELTIGSALNTWVQPTIAPAQITQKEPAIAVTIPALGSLVVAEYYTVPSGLSLTIGAGATLAVVG